LVERAIQPILAATLLHSGVHMLRIAIVALWGVVSALVLPVQHLRADSLSDAYLLPELFDIMAEEGRIAALSDPTVPQDAAGRAGWEGAVNRIYNAERMHDDFIGALDAALSPETRADALEFAQSDLGQRVLQLEVSARRALLSEEIEDSARMALDAARSAPDGSARAAALARARDRIAVNDLIELNVSLGLNTSLAYYRGMVDAGWMDGMAGADLLTLVWAQEQDIRDDVTDWAESYFLLAYQPLSAEDMQSYIDYAASPEGDAFNRAMFRAFDAVFVEISRSVGAAMAAQMQQDTL